MNLIKKEWTIKDYDDFVEYLYSLADLKYKDFHSKLTYNKKIIGINVPTLKNISKEISKGNYESFFSLVKNDSYEEWMIFGLTVSYIKIDFNKKLHLFDKYIINIDNWASCDIVCASMKDFKKNVENGFIYIMKLINSNDLWKVRVGVVLLLDYYVNNDYICDIFKICDDIKSDEYYVKMAVAWLISLCYIKFPELTLKYLNKNNLDDFTYNKAIQKMIESTRVSKDEKEILKKMKK